jgi:hypothetical protein
MMMTHVRAQLATAKGDHMRARGNGDDRGAQIAFDARPP